MVFGFYDAVGGGTFAGDVAVTGEGGGVSGCGKREGRGGKGRGGERYRSTSSPFSFSILKGWVGSGGGLGWLLLWLWMGVRWSGHGLISVCGDRLVAWRIQPYENTGLKAYEF